MSLLLMVDGKGMMASPEDALEVADELLDLALELKDGMPHANACKESHRWKQDKRLEACTLRKLSEPRAEKGSDMIRRSLWRHGDTGVLVKVWNSKLGDRDRAISDAEEAWEIYCDLESPQAKLR